MVEQAVIDWLLASSSPSIRYLTLRDLTGLSEDHPDCKTEYTNIQRTGAVPSILNFQVQPGRWNYPQHYYTPKYTSTHWTMMLLEELLCDPQEPRFQAAADFMLSATENNITKYSQENNSNWACLWGNIIRYVVYAGKTSDERLQNMIDLTAQSLLKEQCKCNWNWQMPCVWGAARSIWGLIRIPFAERSDPVNQAIQAGIDFVLKNVNTIISNQPNQVEKTTHTIWGKINFPLFYQADILFILRLLKELDQLDHPLGLNLLLWLKSRQKPDGRWRGSSPYRQRTYPELGGPEETSRWVTLQATSIIQKARIYA